MPVAKKLKSTLVSSTIHNLYEALSGEFIGRADAPWEQVQMAHALRPGVRETTIHSALRKAVGDYRRVSSPSARQRHGANLVHLGLPGSCASIGVTDTSLVHLPYVVGILDADGRSRAVAVSGRTGEVSDLVSKVLTANLAQVHAQLTT